MGEWLCRLTTNMFVLPTLTSPKLHTVGGVAPDVMLNRSFLASVTANAMTRHDTTIKGHDTTIKRHDNHTDDCGRSCRRPWPPKATTPTTQQLLTDTGPHRAVLGRCPHT